MTAFRLSYRNSNSKAAVVLSRLIPSKAARRKVAEMFVNSCRHAHVQSPSCWDLTLDSSFVRLNVGQVAVLDVKAGELFLCAAPSLPRLAAPAEIGRSRAPVYAAVPIPSVSLRLPLNSIGMLDNRVISAHNRFIVEAANRKRMSPWRSAHSPAAVRVLAEWAGIETPQPAYAVAPPDESELSQDDIEIALGDAAAAKEIEETAIRTVRTWYESRGWKVASVEADRIGYDLRCTKGRDPCHVEVKGRGGSGNVVLLTANEWRRAVEDSRFAIAIVADIPDRPSMRLWTGIEFQRSHDVKPIVFHASQRQNGVG